MHQQRMEVAKEQKEGFGVVPQTKSPLAVVNDWALATANNGFINTDLATDMPGAQGTENCKFERFGGVQRKSAPLCGAKSEDLVRFRSREFL